MTSFTTSYRIRALPYALGEDQVIHANGMKRPPPMLGLFATLHLPAQKQRIKYCTHPAQRVISKLLQSRIGVTIRRPHQRDSDAMAAGSLHVVSAAPKRPIFDNKLRSSDSTYFYRLNDQRKSVTYTMRCEKTCFQVYLNTGITQYPPKSAMPKKL